MDLGQLDEFLDEKLTFTHAGVTYEVAPVDAVTWAKLVKTQAAVERNDITGAEQFADSVELTKAVLVGVYDKLMATNPSGPALQRISRAAYYWQLGEPQIASLIWSADQGKANGPASSESTSTTPTGSTSSASGTATKPRASSTGTRSRTTSKPPSPAKKATSRSR